MENLQARLLEFTDVPHGWCPIWQRVCSFPIPSLSGAQTASPPKGFSSNPSDAPVGFPVTPVTTRPCVFAAQAVATEGER